MMKSAINPSSLNKSKVKNSGILLYFKFQINYFYVQWYILDKLGIEILGPNNHNFNENFDSWFVNIYYDFLHFFKVISSKNILGAFKKKKKKIEFCLEKGYFIYIYFKFKIRYIIFTLLD